MKSLSDLITEAESGNAESQYELGVRYGIGKENTNIDYSLSLYWYQLSAQNNNPLANHDLGVYYFEGVKTNKDFKKALSYFDKAAIYGHAESAYKAGLIWEHIACKLEDFSQRAAANQKFKSYYRSAARYGFAKARKKLIDINEPLICPYSRSLPVPLSFAQERLWFLDHLLPNHSIYNIPVALRLKGILDLTALEQAFNEIIRRHEVLRTYFSNKSKSEQVILPFENCNFSINNEDFSEKNAITKIDDVFRRCEEIALEAFDLGKVPLLRVHLIQMAELDYILMICMHHAISDGWSLNILSEEISNLYNHFAFQHPHTIQPLAIQYADYTLWQREWLQSEHTQSQLIYWCKKLHNVPEVINLPIDKTRPNILSYHGEVYSVEINDELVKKLSKLGEDSQASLFMVFLASFYVLLHRYTNQETIVIGTPIANRNFHEIDRLIGFFVNTLPLRIDIQSNISFKDLLKQVREMTLEAYANQDIPFEKIVKELQISRSINHQPLFQVLIAMQNLQTLALNLSNIDASPFQINYPVAKFDLSLYINENSENGYQLFFEFSTDLFEKQTIIRMAENYVQLLKNITKQPNHKINKAHLLSKTETHQILVEWNKTEADYPIEKTIHQLFEEQVNKTPENIAVVYGEEQLTYRALNDKANSLAHYLQKLGVGAETLVAISAERSLELVIGLLGILKAGGAYVPLDPSYPMDRLQYMLNDTQANLLLTTSQFAEQFKKYQATVLLLDKPEQWSLDPQGKPPSGTSCAEHLAYVIYTSGSTGKPKGVLNTHQGLVNRITWMQKAYPLHASDKVLQKTPFSFDVSVWEFLWPLISGAQLVMAPPEVHKNPEELAQIIQWHGISVIHFVPSMLSNFIETTDVGISCQSLRLVFSSGEVLPLELQKRFFHKLSAELHNLYGPTEAAIDVSFWKCQPTSSLNKVPIGKPIANTQLYILDSNCQPVPIGVAGELYIGGAGLARGYLNRPELTAQRFIENPFISDEERAQGINTRLYRTGDLARYLPDGNIEYIGRVDDQVKIRGYRIELGEIETHIREVKGIKEVVVIAREDEPGQKRLVAYLVMQDRFSEAESTGDYIEQLRLALTKQLPDYMIPSAFQLLESLPLNPNGKIDKKGLPEPNQYYRNTHEEYVAAQTEIEQRLVSIWANLLRREAAKISIHDNFFSSGGDSIISIQLVSQARMEGIQLTVKQIFENPTIAGMALVAKAAPIITNINQDKLIGEVPLLPIQQWFFEKYSIDLNSNNQAFLLISKEKLDANLLESVLQAIVKHHDALRLRFHKTRKKWEQIAKAEDEKSVSICKTMDLSQHPLDTHIEVIKLTYYQLQSSLNITKGPMLGAVLFERGENQSQRLLLVIHHLVVDGVSWRILLEDLAQGYEQAKQKQVIQLPLKTHSYRQWGITLQEYAKSAALIEEMAYWLRPLKEEDLQLPVEKVIGKERYGVETITVGLDEATTQALLQQVPQAYRTQINDVLLTALVLTITEWTGKQGVYLSLEGHGREADAIQAELDLSRTVGWFTSLFPVYLELSAPWSEQRADNTETITALKAIKEQLRQVPRRGIGYGVLRYIKEEGEAHLESIKALPQPQLCFNYLGQLDTALDTGLFTLATESVGLNVAQENEEDYLLAINSFVANGQLVMHWSYRAEKYTGTTIRKLADNYIMHLTRLIKKCSNADNFGYTPSDFPLAKLAQRQIDGLFSHEREIEDIYPLSPMQGGLLFRALYEPTSDDYLIQLVIEIKGDLQEAAMQHAWQELVNRHSILRTKFIHEGLEQPLQCVKKNVIVPWEKEEWCELKEEAQKKRLNELLNKQRIAGFTLSEAPLLKLTLLKMGKDSYNLLINIHHIIIDGWSLSLLLKDVINIYYEVALNGNVISHYSSNYNYRKYITSLAKLDLESAKNFWVKYLNGHDELTYLSNYQKDKHDLIDANFGQYDHCCTFSIAETNALIDLSRQYKVTINTILQTVIGLLISRYTLKNDIILGMTVSGRSMDMMFHDQMVGLFVNTIPIRMTFNAHDDLHLLWQSIQKQMAELIQFSYAPLINIQSWCGLKSGQKLFDILFVFENYPVDGLFCNGMTNLDIKLIKNIEKVEYPLTVVMYIKDRLQCKFIYQPEFFTKDEIVRFAEHMKTLFINMLCKPTQQIGNISLLTNAQKKQTIFDWNCTNIPYPKDKTIHQLFEEQVEKSPESIAIVYGEEQLTYRILNYKANRLAQYLREEGVGTETLVAISAESSIELIIGLLGILKAGGAYVPLDPNYPKERLAYMLQDTKASIILTTSSLSNQFSDFLLKVILIDKIEIKIKQTNIKQLTKPNNLIYIMYTSGSTGKPKGVMTTHRGVVRLVKNNYINIVPSDNVAFASNLSFDASTFEIWSALLNGAKLVIIERNILLTSTLFVSALQDYEISILWLTKSLFDQLAYYHSDAFFKIKSLIIGGEALNSETVAKVLNNKNKAPRYIINGYGPTENTTFSTSYIIENCLSSDRLIPIGRPLGNSIAYILDNHLQPVPIGLIGELYVGGAGLARGYLNRPELTAQRFIENPFVSDDERVQDINTRLYRTGDLARYLPDGNIEYIGRVDDQVKIRGYRFELGEIETHIRQVEGIKEVVVIAREDEPGQKRLVAYLVMQDRFSEAATAGDYIEQLRLALAKQLPDYMIPGAFQLLESLPLNSNGKIDKKGLPEPNQYYRNTHEEYVPARTEIEQRLVSIWANLLRREAAKISIHDNFFSSGGDSIISIQLVSQARMVGIQLTVKQIFENPTIAGMALVAKAAPIITNINQDKLIGEVPLLPIQHWFFEKQLKNPHYFNQAFLLISKEKLEIDLLEQALQALQKHHDMLRTRFYPMSDNWQQTISTEETLPYCQIVDLSAVEPSLQEKAMLEQSNQLQSSLNITKGPILGAMLFDRGENQSQRLLLVIHHLVVDGVSWRILLEDLAQGYEQAKQKQVIQLPLKTHSYRQWGITLQEYAKSAALIEEMAYWLRPLKEEDLQLPVEKVIGKERYGVETITVGLDETRTQALLQQVPQAYRTQINDVLLTALVQTITEWTGKHGVYLSLEGHGREADAIQAELDLSRTVGWFTSLFPVYLYKDISAKNIPELLKSIKEQLHQIPNYGIGYGVLRYLSHKSKKIMQLKKLQLPEISFNYLGQFDNLNSNKNMFSLEQELPGRIYEKTNQTNHLLNLNSRINNGCFSIGWTYSKDHFLTETVKTLADNYIIHLTHLIKECCNADNFGYTPSDFPLVRQKITQSWLDDYFNKNHLLQDILPLSPMQSGLLFRTLYAPNLDDYFVQTLIEIRGNIKENLMRKAWQEIINNYDALRTGFIINELDDPVQYVQKQVVLPWESHDWQESTANIKDRNIETFILSQRQNKFNLEMPPLMRVQLLKIATNHFYLLVNIHHIIIDGWSLPIIFKEVFKAYQHFLLNPEKPLYLNPPYPYRNYIAWLQIQDTQQAITFWKGYLQNLIGPTRLSIRNKTSESNQEVTHQDYEDSYTFEDTQKLQAFARSNQITLNTVIQAAVTILLFRYNQQEDLVLGVTVSGRSAEIANQEKMVGLFINTLPMRIRLSSDKKVMAYLQQIQREMAELNRHAYVPLAQIQNCNGHTGGQGLFDTLYIFENYPLEQGATETSEFEIVSIRGIEKTEYPLTIAVIPEEKIKIKFSYKIDELAEDVIKRLAQHLQQLLRAIIECPDKTVDSLALITEAEKRQLIVEWNKTETDYPREKAIHQLFEEQVNKTPENIAVVYGEEQLTYRALNDKANSLAHYLQKLGVGAETLVAISAERSLELVIGLLGILKAGGAYVPLDPSYPMDRLQYMLNDTQANLLLTTSQFAEQFKKYQATVLLLDKPEQWSLDPQGKPPSGTSCAEHLAYVIYTSGSTGKPKGVLNTHQGLVNRITWMQKAYPLHASDKVLQKTPFSFDVSVWEFLWPLISGAQLVMAPPEVHKNPEELAQIIQWHGISVIHFVPSMLSNFIETTDVGISCQSLRLVFSSGEVLPLELQKRFFHKLSAELHNLYGPTEAAIDVSFWKCQPTSSLNKVPIGKPIANTQLYILDSNCQPVPIGVAGELYIGGAGLARGYLNKPELTAERFIENPFVSDEERAQGINTRLYRTGDLARYLPDGNIEYIGRVDDQVKIRGYRIELGEIETHIREVKGIKEVVVIAREDEPGQKRLVAYFVMQDKFLEAGTAGDYIEQLRQALTKQLPDYMIPSAFQLLDKLPLNANGKINRIALPLPTQHYRQQTEQYISPRNDMEKILCEIWCVLLKIENDKISIHDNFFKLGGDSIISIQLVARARQQNIRINVKQVFEYPTIAELAEVAQRYSNKMVEISQDKLIGEMPLLPIQHWFFEKQLKNPHYFNQAFLLTSKEKLEIDLLEQALQALQKHHDMLRTRFYPMSDNWQQTILTEETLSYCQIVDLSAVEPSLQEETMLEQSNQLQSNLNITKGPMLGAILFDRGENQSQRLLLVIHHLVVDGVSWRILLEDLAQGYEQAKQKQVIQLPLKTHSYRQWGIALQEYAKSAAFIEEMAYWLRPLKEENLQLPVEKVIGKERFGIETITVGLDEATTQALLQQVPQAYRTQINDVLLTALVQTITEWTGKHGVYLSLEGHGREADAIQAELDLSRTVGWFTSLFPVYLELSAPWSEQRADNTETITALKAIKKQLRQVPRRGIGYGVLRYIKEEGESRLETIKTLPQPQLCFNYLGQLDTALDTGLFTLATESVGLNVAQENEEDYLLAINSFVANGQLVMHWSYRAKKYTDTTIHKLADNYIIHLTHLIKECCDADNFGYTPSDFPLAKLAQRQIDGLFSHEREIEDIYPLSPMQGGLLFRALYEPTSDDYLIQLVLEIKGNLQEVFMQRAWQELVNRHSILRTKFIHEGLEQPLQCVKKNVIVPWEKEEWCELKEEAQKKRLNELLNKQRIAGFTLSEAPLLKLTLLKMGQENYNLIINIHHIIIDGWSLPIIFKEVFKAYQHFLLNPEKPLYLNPPYPYRNYIAWLQIQDTQQAITFWKGYLQNLIGPTRLSIRNKTSESNQEVTHQDYEDSYTFEDTQKLQAFARSNQITLNTVIQAAVTILLFRYNQQEDLVLGVTVSGRSAEIANQEKMVGLFINTLPMRIRLSSDKKVMAYLQQIQREMAELNRHAYVPLAQIQNCNGHTGGQGLFDTLYIFENYPLEQGATETSEFEIVSIRGIEKTEYPLTIAVIPEEKIKIKFSYKIDELAEDVIKRLAQHLQQLLRAIIECPDKTVDSLALITEAEKRQLIVEWNKTETDYPREKAIHQLFEEQVNKTPENIAVIYGENNLTYQELNKKANQLAYYLYHKGVRSGDSVAVSGNKNLELIIGLLAIIKCGGVFIAIDTALPPDRMENVLKETKSKILLATSICATKFNQFNIEVINIYQTKLRGDHFKTFSHLSSSIKSDNLAYINYTSGSSGEPKGVMVTHASLCNAYYGWKQIYCLDHQLNCLQMANFTFDVFIGDVVRALCSGGKLILCSREILLNPIKLYKSLVTYQINFVEFVPAVLRCLISYMHDNSLTFPTSLRLLVVGSDTWTIDDYKDIRACCSEKTSIINSYGLTETTIDSTYYQCCTINLKSINTSTIIPIGKPFPNTKLYLISHKQLVPIGIVGELYIGGAGLARGYLNRPELTAQRFIENPFISDEERVQGINTRLYRTGDLARYLPDGNIEYIGRVDDQVKIRGYRIELGEIEMHIREVEGIKEVVVIAREDEPGQKRLVAYLVMQDRFLEAETTGDYIEQLRLALAKQLPDYMIPSAFQLLESLPLNPNGKIDKKGLPEPNQYYRQQTEQCISPRYDTEKILCEIWCVLLKIEKDKISIHDNFFKLGGDSIISIQLVARARQQNIRINVKQVFEYPTIAELAEVAQRYSNKMVEISQDKLIGEVPLLPIQQWFFEKYSIDLNSNNQAFLLISKEKLDANLLESVLQAIVKHHDALRLRFHKTRKKWEQIAKAEDEKSVSICKTMDLSQHPLDTHIEVIKLTYYQLQSSLNITKGPMLGAVLFERGENQSQRLLLVIHHLVVDGVSWRILLEDLAQGYEQAKQKQVIQLPLKTHSYRQWGITLQEYAKSAALIEEMAYWLRPLKEEDLQLPVEKVIGKERYGVETITVGLDEATTQALLQQVPQAYRTQINDVLLTALVLTITEWTGKQGVYLSLEGHGREADAIQAELDLSRTVGWFTSLFPVYLELSAPWSEQRADNTETITALKAIKEQLRQVPRRGIGYGVLRYIKEEGEAHLESIKALPQPQLCFNYLGQLDTALDTGLFTLATESVGLNVAQENEEDYLLAINSFVANGQLVMHWSYRAEKYTGTTIHKLADNYMLNIRNLIQKCCSSERTKDVFQIKNKLNSKTSAKPLILI